MPLIDTNHLQYDTTGATHAERAKQRGTAIFNETSKILEGKSTDELGSMLNGLNSEIEEAQKKGDQSSIADLMSQLAAVQQKYDIDTKAFEQAPGGIVQYQKPQEEPASDIDKKFLALYNEKFNAQG